MKLGTKMLVAPLLIAVVAIAAGLVYGGVDQRESQRADQANAADNQTHQVIAQAREDVARMRGDVYRTLVLIASLDDATVKAARDKLAQDTKGVQTPLAALSEASAGDEAVRTLTARLGTQLAEYLKRCDKAVDLSGMDPNVGAASMRAAEDVYALVSKDLDALGDRFDSMAALRAEAASRLQLRLQAGLALALLAALAGAAVVIWRVRRRVVVELQQAVALCEATARGDLALAGTSAREAGADEIGDLQRALGRMVTDLSQALATVRDATHEIGTASAQIASGNADLSQRTDQAAGSLQQTAASMEQFTGTVQQTAESAGQANQLAASASRVAERGGQVVSQVVATMQEINESSRRIADIIGTIDGIAFQTNILALNAAVEAARAGEQGRGFAVVATEVRSLAQRSAAAAREIKSLIGTSVDRVEMGTQQVAQAGSTMTEIVASVRRVSGIIGEISNAAGEQSAGIGQVNAAVAKLDSATQQNAALVEQSAAAADSLHQQVELLASVVSRFRLADAPADG